jgi:uncharacterized membrane protein
MRQRHSTTGHNIRYSHGMKSSRHLLLLAGILLLGTLLRFWNLDGKPLWLDEVITALFSLGRDYYQIPLERAFAVGLLDSLFTLKPGITCPQIVQTVSTQSVHPPLFFCWMHQWLSWTAALPQSWIWKLRAFPALLGVVAIAATYRLNRVAFSNRAGLLGAMVMAVSPFAVYLSQEARHYTLPMLLVILALLGLYEILTDLKQRQFRPAIWIGWVAANGIGFYVHYFFLLAFVAQAVTLVLLGWQRKEQKAEERQKDGERGRGGEGERGERAERGKSDLRVFEKLGGLESPSHYPMLLIAIAIAAVCLTYLPWLPTFLSHMSRPETDWIEPSRSGWLQAIAPLYQFPISWVLMVVALPVENQPLWIAVPAVLAMLLFAGWLIWQMPDRLRQLWSNPASQLGTRMLTLFVLVVLLQFLAIVYLLGKDMTMVPRYNFIYFPAVCALLGAGLGERQKGKSKRQKAEEKVKGKRQKAKGGESDLRVFEKLGGLESPKVEVFHPSSPIPHPPVLIWAVLLMGVLSSAAVVSDLAFQKPYQPQRVAETMQVEPQVPLLVGMAYGDWQDVALGLGFALALRQQDAQQAGGRSQSQFVFLKRDSYEQVWQTLSSLKQPLSPPLHLWVIAPGLKRRDYPAQLAISAASAQGAPGVRSTCQLDSQHHHRIGIPYQLYRCP